jgi:hypothetical protein
MKVRGAIKMAVVTGDMLSIVGGVFHQDLSLDHQRRLQKYREYWLYYLGKHWSYQRDPGDKTITINYSRRIVDIGNDFTFKKGFLVKIPDDPATVENEREDREFVRQMLEETWRKNNKALWILDAGQQGGVTGDVFARVSWEASDELEDPYARVDVIPSHLVFPEFGGPTGVDRKKLKRVLVLSPVYEKTREVRRTASIFPPTISRMEVVMYYEDWTAPEYGIDGTLIKPAMVQNFRNNEPLGPPRINPLGEIPIVHIANYPLSGEFFGVSDLVDLTELNRELNEKITDISDIINYHGSPVTILNGAKIQNLERGANRIWGLPENATAHNLELSGDLSASTKHWRTLKESMLEIGGIPEEVLGKLQAGENLSGVALAIRYMPLMEKRNIKVLTYGTGLRRINRLIMKTTALADPVFGSKFDALTQGNKYRNEVIFPDPMPQDEGIELEKSRARLDLRLSTRRLELEREGKSQAEIDRILTDTRAEDEEAMELENKQMFDQPSIGRGQFQNARGGLPEVRAEKVSATAAKKAAPGSIESGE